MQKTYSPKEIEAHWTETWEARGYFAPDGQGEPYCIMIPPPNVTGTLHMGHAFQDTIMDALTRYHRMQGRNTLWQPGCDHAGIATQMVVERQINAEGLTRQDLGREEFVKRIWEWKEVSGGAITQQLRRMGASVDWENERFTMDNGCSEAVRETFVQLYEEGLIYRGKRLVNWDPVLRTAVSDLEVLSEEEEGHLWHIRYPLADGSGHVIVATTRPETMLGDTAVAVNPDDDRNRHLQGKQVSLPLTDRRIPIITDDYVDPEFGTGCLKITPAHDFNDYQVGERHGLDRINIFTPDARINDQAPERYRGLDRLEARQRIVEDLQAQDLIEKIEPHKLMVPRGDRSHAVIEPYLTDQWFVRAEPLARPAIEAVENGDIRFVPEHWSKTYFEWMRNIEDWCISRQIWWGHRVPAWYDPDGNVYVGRNEEEIRHKHGLPASLSLEQDTDVLDTWYSSALWPFSTLGWPQDTDRLKAFYPTSVLVTGFDIIFFWVARMVMFGLKFQGKPPFAEIYIHGLVRDADGNKMSKSKGNILDPMDLVDGISLDELIAKRTTGLMQPHLAPRIVSDTRRQFPDGIPSFGTDALRFTFCSLATQGRDIRFDLGRIEGYRNFCNKLWNAARFVVMNVEGQDIAPAGGDMSALPLAERWVRSRFGQTVAAVDSGFAQYRFDLAAQAIYEFTWNEYCDWYVEIAKSALRDDALSEIDKAVIRRNLVEMLETMLRLAHPLMPFITEAIWQQVAPLAERDGETIMHAAYPQSAHYAVDDEALAMVNWLKTFVLAVRKIRGELDVKPGRKLDVLLQNAAAEDRARADALYPALAAMGGIASISYLGDDDAPPEAAFGLIDEMKLLVPLEGLIDKDAERARLSRELDKLAKNIERTEAKLKNPKFVERAPADVVELERERLSDMVAARDKLVAQLKRLD